jgi:hypothetical protein
MGIGVLVLEAGLNKFFDYPTMWKLLEVVMTLLSLGDTFKNERNKWIRKYYCNNFGNDWLWLVVPCGGEVDPSCGSQVPDTILLMLRMGMCTKDQLM